MRRLLLAVLATTPCLLAGCGSQPNVTFSNYAYDFGTVVLNTANPVASSRDAVTISNNTSSVFTLSTTLTGSATFAAVAGGASTCGTTLAPNTRCAVVISFLPNAGGSFTNSLTVLASGAGGNVAAAINLTGAATTLQQGGSLVSTTGNPQVALYTWYPTAAGSLSVAYGTSTSYGHTTGTMAVTGLAPVSVYVAGMLQSTPYHMHAQVVTAAGQSITDTDHSFTTGAWTGVRLPSNTVTTTGTPSPGVEFVNVTDLSPIDDLPVYQTDLTGNLLWAYRLREADLGTTIVQGVHQLANADYLLQQSPASQAALAGDTFTVNTLREVDLAGNIVRELTVPALNAKLTAAGYTFTALTIHHDTQVLPNGHILVLVNSLRPYTNLTGLTGTTNVLGDQIVDLDTNWNIAWVWNSFDHLDVNRHPTPAFPDWTHCNEVIYSPTDHQLILSSRHQSWVMKLNYLDGTGDGSVIWHLGRQGDFTLVNGTDPIDWQYAQHFPSLISASSSPVLQLTMIDNGDYRYDSTGTDVCPGTTGTNCYSTVPVFTIDENAKTATVTYRYKPANYSFFGGEAHQLANGNLEFDLSSQPNTSALVKEVTYDAAQTTVWQMVVNNANAYRAGRVLGIYPDVPY